MRVFCTYFDSNYLDRGLCLWESLSRHLPSARLFVVCLDDKAFEVLDVLAIQGVDLVRLTEVEAQYPALADAKSDRSRVEYIFTLTPSCIRYVFDTRDVFDEVTYLDSDLLFFSDPTPLFRQMDREGASVGIIEHRFTPPLRHLSMYGTYNVGWVTFRRSTPGWACLLDWQRQCIEWCHDRLEGDRFADQKYLDAWPTRYPEIAVLRHPGANVALWNLEKGSIKRRRGRLMLYDHELIFYHYHGLSQLGSRLFFTNARLYNIELDGVVRRRVYGAYMAALRSAQKRLRRTDVRPLIRYKHSRDDIAYARRRPFSGLFLISIGSFSVP